MTKAKTKRPRTLDDIERLDRLFKKRCKARARAERASARSMRGVKADFAAAAAEERATVWDDLATHGFAVVDD